MSDHSITLSPWGHLLGIDFESKCGEEGAKPRNTNVPDYSSVVWCSAAPKVHKHHQLAEPLLNQDLQVKGDIV